MSILKRSKQNMSNFRPAVGSTENESDDNPVENQENQSELRQKLIDDMAQQLLDKPSKRKNPLDMVSRNVNVALSPRTEAQWRFVANQEGRNMSDFVRRAVDFYIRKHGLDK